MNNYEDLTLKEAIKLYYGEVSLSEDQEKEVEEMLREIEESGFLEKCKEIVKEKEDERKRKIINIGRMKINRVAGFIFLICFISLLGGTVYATVVSNIKNIEVVEKGDHSELTVDYNDSTDVNPSIIKEYYMPVRIPLGYYLDSEERYVDKYRLVYISDDDQIVYTQTLPSVKYHYSTEDGLSEKVNFGRYSGEFIETESGNYLIVTDGTYIYSLIADTVNKQELIKMLQ